MSNDNIVEELRECATHAGGEGYTCNVMRRAAAEIKRLRAELQALKAQMAGQEPVAYAINVRGKGMRTTIYTEVLPFHPDTGIEQIGEPVPLYAAPPAAQDVSGQWVSVSERLPDEHKSNYLCLFADGYQQVTEWLLDDTEGWCFWYGDPTHWMPLPAAPAHRQAQQQAG